MIFILKSAELPPARNEIELGFEAPGSGARFTFRKGRVPRKPLDFNSNVHYLFYSVKTDEMVQSGA